MGIDDVDLNPEAGILAASVRPISSIRNRCGARRTRCPRFDFGDGRRRWRCLDAGSVPIQLEAAALLPEHQDATHHPHRLRLHVSGRPDRPRHAHPRRPRSRPPRPGPTHGYDRRATSRLNFANTTVGPGRPLRARHRPEARQRHLPQRRRPRRIGCRGQRLLTARDGGCLVPGCDRPPRRCEATTSTAGIGTPANPTSSAESSPAGTPHARTQQRSGDRARPTRHDRAERQRAER